MSSHCKDWKRKRKKRKNKILMSSKRIIMMSIKLMLWRSYNKHSTSTVETMSDYVLSSKVKTNKILGIKSV